MNCTTLRDFTTILILSLNLNIMNIESMPIFPSARGAYLHNREQLFGMLMYGLNKWDMEVLVVKRIMMHNLRIEKEDLRVNN